MRSFPPTPHQLSTSCPARLRAREFCALQVTSSACDDRRKMKFTPDGRQAASALKRPEAATLNRGLPAGAGPLSRTGPDREGTQPGRDEFRRRRSKESRLVPKNKAIVRGRCAIAATPAA